MGNAVLTPVASNSKISPMPKPLLVFDLDGTLLNTKEDIVFAANEAFSQLGLPPLSEVDVTQYIGIGVTTLLQKLLLAHGGVDVTHAIKLFHEAYEKCCEEKTTVYSGVMETLEKLKGYKKVVLTNKSQRFSRRSLETYRLMPYFLEVYSRESFSAYKPSPIPLQEIAKIYSYEPKDIWMIGDTIIDMKAGKAAGVKTCALLYGYGFESDLRALSPDYVLSSITQLPEVFENK